MCIKKAGDNIVSHAPPWQNLSVGQGVPSARHELYQEVARKTHLENVCHRLPGVR